MTCKQGLHDDYIGKGPCKKCRALSQARYKKSEKGLAVGRKAQAKYVLSPAAQLLRILAEIQRSLRNKRLTLQEYENALRQK